MAKVKMFMLCDVVNNESSDRGIVPHLINPRAVLRPKYIPGNFSFGVSIGVRDVDLTLETKIKFSVCEPDGTVIQESNEIDITRDAIGDRLPKEHQGFVLNLDIRNLEVKEEGVYNFTLYINGEALESQEIPIFKGI